MTIVVYVHWTKSKFSTCPVYQNMKFPTHIRQRIGQNTICKQLKCVENLALSYKFPTRMVSKFSSSDTLPDLEVRELVPSNQLYSTIISYHYCLADILDPCLVWSVFVGQHLSYWD